MAENQQGHRLELEKKIVSEDSTTRKMNSIFAFILTFTVILIGGFLIYKGKNIAGLGTVFLGLAPLVVQFSNKKDEKDEDESE